MVQQTITNWNVNTGVATVLLDKPSGLSIVRSRRGTKMNNSWSRIIMNSKLIELLSEIFHLCAEKRWGYRPTGRSLQSIRKCIDQLSKKYMLRVDLKARQKWMTQDILSRMEERIMEKSNAKEYNRLGADIKIWLLNSVRWLATQRHQHVSEDVRAD